jgi:excisionase family DNA binding protein
MAARFLTPAEAAEQLRVSPDTIHRLISTGALAAIRVSPRVVRIPLPAFEAFQAGRKPSRRRVVRRSVGAEPRLGEATATRDPQHV